MFLISPKSLCSGKICSPGVGLGVTGEQAKSNILSEVSFFLSCQNKTKNSKSYTSHKNKRPKILSNLHFWDFPSKTNKTKQTLLWVFFPLVPTPKTQDFRWVVYEGL